MSRFPVCIQKSTKQGSNIFKLICPCTIAFETQTGSQREKKTQQKFHSFLSRSLYESFVFTPAEKTKHVQSTGEFPEFFWATYEFIIWARRKCAAVSPRIFMKTIFYRFFMAVHKLITRFREKGSLRNTASYHNEALKLRSTFKYGSPLKMNWDFKLFEELNNTIEYVSTIYLSNINVFTIVIFNIFL